MTVDERKQRKMMQRRKRRTSGRKKSHVGLIFFLAVLLLVIVAAGILLSKRYGPSNTRADLNEYYGITNNDQLAVVLNNEVIGAEGFVDNGTAYIAYQLIHDHINGKFYLDQEGNVLLYTLPESLITVEADSSSYQNGQEQAVEDYPIWESKNGTAYIALPFVQQYTNIDFQTYEGPNRVMIVSDWGETKTAQAEKKAQVRYRAGVKSDVLSEVKKGDTVTVIDEDVSGWKHVRTKDGFIGYMQNGSLTKVKTESISRDFTEPEYTNISKDYKINMVWDNVTNVTANDSVGDRLAQTKGVTTISPTWFSIADISGNMNSISSSNYVAGMHASHIEVWPTLRDFDSEGGINSSEETATLLKSTRSRQNLESKIVSAALAEGFDGINLDFEKVTEESGDDFIQFVRELSIQCRINGIVLSIDNYVPKNYNQHYDRKEQGKVADYVIIMGYDEHTYGSEESGSVASYDFVKEGIERTLEDVPSDKVINAIPFYTRIWKEENGKISFESYDMQGAIAQVGAAGAQATWDDVTKQNYAQWEEGNATYKIWLEDAQSVQAKLELMSQYDLAGVSAWRLGQETPEVWNEIVNYVNN